MDDLVLLPRPRWIEIAPRAEPRRSALPSQAYRLVVRDGSVTIESEDAAGAFYAEQTLLQLRRQLGSKLPDLAVEDWPDVPVRAVMLDISRDKVPTVATLRELIARLASWKVNHIQLYMEHTFAYAGHEEVWAEASPLTAEDVRDLVEWSRSLHVELAPNQNCLGHMERWLRHHRYRPLAIAPDGWQDRRGRLRPPTTIDPAREDSLALVRDLLGQVVPLFENSSRVHVGLDEPWELPQERLADYLDYIAALRAAAELDGREMLMWGDILASHPEAAARLPPDVTVCDWGYEAGSPFADRAAWLSSIGRRFWVCPGTSSWNTLVGRFTNSRLNCLQAAEAAVDHGAAGLMVTDWGDNGHLQPLPISEPGLAVAAAASWCLAANRSVDVAAALSAHSFLDDSGELATALLELGDAHTLVTPQVPNMSVLVMHLYWPQLRLGTGFTDGLTLAELSAVTTTIDGALARLGQSKPRRGDGQLVVDEVRWAAELLRLLVDDASARLESGDGTLASVDLPTRSTFVGRLRPLIEEHRRLWLARNRPGGLPDSASRLTGLLRAYESPPAA